MKNLSLFILLSVFTISIGFSQTIVRIENLDDLSMVSARLIGHFKCISLFEDIENMGNFRYYSQNNTKYVEGRGTISQDGSEHKIVFRVPVRKVGKHIIMLSAFSGESCTSVNCTQCNFAPEDGCACKNDNEPNTICNHSIFQVGL